MGFFGRVRDKGCSVPGEEGMQENHQLKILSDQLKQPIRQEVTVYMQLWKNGSGGI